MDRHAVSMSSAAWPLVCWASIWHREWWMTDGWWWVRSSLDRNNFTGRIPGFLDKLEELAMMYAMHGHCEYALCLLLGFGAPRD